ncbi:MAG: hypothetical protein EAZ08_08990 [Cytophagales bacterium]|nr:MAG: hypothetical protein EAZ08_08990 [Cytophagales bacterium]
MVISERKAYKSTQIIGTFLIFCFIAPITTIYTFFQYQKAQIKKEVKQKIIRGIDKNELVLLKFATTEVYTKLDWEHAKEFGYRGEMYDIVETAIVNDTTYFWVWWDNEETKISKQLDKLIEAAMGSNHTNNQIQKQLDNFLKALYFLEKTDSHAMFVCIESKDKFSFEPIFFLSFCPLPTSPPPEKI